MGKKKRKHRGPSADELIALKRLRAEEWAFTARSAHESYVSMSKRVALPTEQGGLGYAISAPQLSQLVTAFYERMAAVLTESPELHRERELADLDLLQRAAGVAMARAEAAGAYDVNAAREYRTIGERRARLLGLDAIVDNTPVVDDAAVTAQLNVALVRLGQKPLER